MRYLFGFLIILSISKQCTAQTKPNKSYQYFIPIDYTVLDKATGNLNKDAYPDMVLVLKSKNEHMNEDSARPVLLLAGTKSGTYKLIARGDSVVLCKGCAAYMVIPTKGLQSKTGIFPLNIMEAVAGGGPEL